MSFLCVLACIADGYSRSTLSGMRSINASCRKRSKPWSGFCGNSEDAEHGACRFDFPGFGCFSYFDR
ncbi:hypothetical protein IMY05_009G0099300 [Salix suchowensis]|nr:hypothetical protein IMY05_009G0099300 [Salix suchowensis]